MAGDDSKGDFGGKTKSNSIAFQKMADAVISRFGITVNKNKVKTSIKNKIKYLRDRFYKADRVYIPIRQCARDLICDLMIHDFLVHHILQVPSHYPASPHILLLSRNTSGSSKIQGDAGDKMRGNTRFPVETRSLSLQEIL